MFARKMQETKANLAKLLVTKCYKPHKDIRNKEIRRGFEKIAMKPF